MEEMIASAANAILAGISLHLCIFSFFFSRFAKKRIEKAGFFLCSLTLLGLCMYTAIRLTFSWWVAFCFFMGFSMAAMALANQITKSDSPKILNIGKMRKASESSRNISAMMLSLLTLVLPMGLFVPTRSVYELAVVLLVLLLIALVISMIADYLARPSRLSCFISALSGYFFMLAALVPYARVLAGDGGSGTSLSLALCAAVSIFLLYHAAALSKLSPYELALARSPGRRSIVSLRHSLARPGVPRTRAVLSWLIDILARLSLGLSGFIRLFLTGAIAFLILFLPPTVSWKDFSSPPEAIDQKMIAMIVGLHFALISGAVLFSGLAVILQRASRSLSRASYEATVGQDERPPILFLRAFRNDQARLPRLPLYRRLWRGDLETPTLDHQLINEFSLLGPVVALGTPGEDKLPFGASRLYVGTDDWMRDVIRIAKTAFAVVVVCAETESIDLEISALQAEGLFHKVLFLANPETPTKGLEAHERVKPMLPDSTVSVVVGFYQVSEGSRTLICDTLKAEDYIVCCNAFFVELIEPGLISHTFDRLALS